MVQYLFKLIFSLNKPLTNWLHEGQYLLIYNTYEVEISQQLRKQIFQVTLQTSHS